VLSCLIDRLRHGAWFACLLAALGAVLGVLLAIDRQADRHLAADAERAAVGWARHIAVHVPDIDLVFTGDLPSPQAQDRLTSLRGTAGLFRFKLFDPRADCSWSPIRWGRRRVPRTPTLSTRPRPCAPRARVRT